MGMVCKQHADTAAAARSYKKGDPAPFFGVADFGGKYDALFDGNDIFVFFCCCFSNVRAWEPYCCALPKESKPQKTNKRRGA